MVYEKKKSGDPDYDDKVPLTAHAGGTLVKSDDGREVFISDVNGPVDEFGAHVTLEGPTAEDLDNRPEPGGQATEPSQVQTYAPEDVAPNQVDAIPLEQYKREQAEKNADQGATPADAAATTPKTEQPAEQPAAKTSKTSSK